MTANAITACANDNSCLQAEFDRADKLAAAYDVALTLSHYPQLSKEKADTLAQAVLDLAPGVSNASALYELLTDKTATGDEANRYFAAIGLVPVLGGIVKKGGQAVHVFAEADKAIDAAKVGGKVEVAVPKGISIVIEPKIAKQMGNRGWTESSIEAVINNPAKIVLTKDTCFDSVSGMCLNEPATGYIAKDGSYVVKNDRTGAVVQASNKNDPNWVAPWE